MSPEEQKRFTQDLVAAFLASAGSDRARLKFGAEVGSALVDACLAKLQDPAHPKIVYCVSAAGTVEMFLKAAPDEAAEDEAAEEASGVA